VRGVRGKTYWDEQAPYWCNNFPKSDDPDPSRDDDYEGGLRCVRQCLHRLRWSGEQGPEILAPSPSTAMRPAIPGVRSRARPSSQSRSERTRSNETGISGASAGSCQSIIPRSPALALVIASPMALSALGPGAISGVHLLVALPFFIHLLCSPGYVYAVFVQVGAREIPVPRRWWVRLSLGAQSCPVYGSTSNSFSTSPQTSFTVESK
jgi:hypothetical protein